MRRAEGEDWPRLLPLLRHLKSPYTLEQRAAILRATLRDAGALVLVAEARGEVVGLMTAERQEGPAGPVCFISMAYSRNAEASREGMRELEDWCRERGIRRLATAYSGAHPAALVRRWGFRVESIYLVKDLSCPGQTRLGEEHRDG